MSIADLENLKLFYNTHDKLAKYIEDRFEKHFAEAEQKRNKIKTKEELKEHIDFVRKDFITMTRFLLFQYLKY